MKDKVFCFGRFGNLMRWLAVSQGSQLLRKAASIAAVFLLMELMLLLMMGDYDNPCFIEFMMGMCAATYFFIVLSFFSGYLGGMRDKRKRVGMLMLPATNAEKFVAMFVWTVVIGAVAALVSMAVADTLRWGICQLLRWHTSFGTGMEYFLTNICPMRAFGANRFSSVSAVGMASAVLFNVWLVWHCSLFMLVGTLFRRMPTFMSFVVSASLFLVGMYCLSFVSDSIFAWLDGSDIHMTTLAYVFSAALVAEGLLNVWLSYRLFCRLTVGGGRWLNF